MENNEKKVRSLKISVEQWHELALEGISSAVTLRLDGESMRPLIRKQRDSVTVFPVSRPIKKGDIVLFIRHDGTYVIHRAYKIKGEAVITLGDNCVEFDAPIPVSSVWGLAVRLERNGKRINLDSALSRAYGIMGMYTRPARFALRELLRFGARIKKGIRR